jgi:hypothetical protein
MLNLHLLEIDARIAQSTRRAAWQLADEGNVSALKTLLGSLPECGHEIDDVKGQVTRALTVAAENVALSEGHLRDTCEFDARVTELLGDEPEPPTYFFDSHGGLWSICTSAHPSAEAFGPCFTARRVDEIERFGLSLSCHQRTPWGVAKSQRRVREWAGWDVLAA